MITIGTVTGQEIRKNKNGAVDVRLLKVRLSNPDDVQTVQYFSPSGEDSAPITGEQVIVFTLAQSFKVAIGAKDTLAAVMGAGEKKLYSKDSGGSIAAFLDLLADGNINLNGDAYSAVRFAALNTALQTLVTSVNTALAGKLDGSGTAGALTLDISTAESDTVRLK